MCPVPAQLVHQAIFPVQIRLHGFARGIGAFVRAAVAVDAGRGQSAFAVLQRQAGLDPAGGAAFEQKHRLVGQCLKVGDRKARQTAAAAGQHIAVSGRQVAQRLLDVGTQGPPGTGNVLFDVIGAGGEIQHRHLDL